MVIILLESLQITITLTEGPVSFFAICVWKIADIAEDIEPTILDLSSQ